MNIANNFALIFDRQSLVFLLIFCSLSSISSQESGNLFDPADTTSAIDLAKTPLAIDLFRRSGLLIQDLGLKKQLNEEFESLKTTIEQSLSEANPGCLLEVRMYTNPEGAIAIPGGQLIAFEDTGKNPIDALANARMTAAIRAEPLASPFENQSYYVWIKKEKGALKAGIIPRELRDALEMDANVEVERRVRMANVNDALESSQIATLDRDKYWNEVAHQTIATFHNASEQRKLQNLAHEFAAEQHRFNEAYEQFKQKEQELQEQQQQVQTLETISRLTGIVISAIQSGEIISSIATEPITVPSTNGQNEAKIMIEYHQTQINSLTGEIHELGEKVDLRGATLRQLNDQLVNMVHSHGIDVPDSKQKLVLPSGH